ncbi:gamma carbonic anhydrase family protein [Leptospira interrogans]
MGLYSLDGVKVTTPGEGRYWVADNAIVLGNVHIGENASIWFNTVARGDSDEIVIGAGSNVQDGCVLHADPGYPMIIEENCTIGHMVMLHGCRVGRGSLIGIGSIILNGAVIGEECLIGSHSLIPEGKVIPPRSVVMGSPGKVVREVTDADLRRMQGGTNHYQKNWRRFVSGLKAE